MVLTYYIIGLTPGKRHANADALSRMPCKACKRQMDNSSDSIKDSNIEKEIPMPVKDNSEFWGAQTYAVTKDSKALTHSLQDPSYLMAGMNLTSGIARQRKPI